MGTSDMSQPQYAEAWTLVELLNRQPVKFGKVLLAMRKGTLRNGGHRRSLRMGREASSPQQWRAFVMTQQKGELRRGKEKARVERWGGLRMGRERADRTVAGSARRACAASELAQHRRSGRVAALGRHAAGRRCAEQEGRACLRSPRAAVAARQDPSCGGVARNANLAPRLP